ncbi:hypothetical protein DV736_g901, partial [Chaetothyriales sp. CBS 134916]
MRSQFVGVTLFLSIVVQAHFELIYPYSRGDSFLPPASQYIYPCANINQSAAIDANRTLWPLDGGSLEIKFHHPYTYVWINIGLGEVIAAFNYTLTQQPLNETGNGTICIPKFKLPEEVTSVITNGTDASLQVVTVGDGGTALYNCADITFSSNATILSGDHCINSTGLTLEPLLQQENGTLVGAASSSTSAGESSTSSAGASANTGGANLASEIGHAPVIAAILGLVGIALL